MKKTVNITLTYTVELDINDECLTPEYIEEFESYMFDVGGKPEGIFEYVASQFVQQIDPTFIEAIGECDYAGFRMKESPDVLYKGYDLGIETEVL